MPVPIYTWTTPVTDRTFDDILNKTQKAYMVPTWNRVDGNNTFLQDRLQTLLGIVASQVLVTSLAGIYIPVASDLNNLTSNIESIRSTYPDIGLAVVPADYGPGVHKRTPNWRDANQWESTQLGIYESLSGTLQETPVCGIAICGAELFEQSGFQILE